MSATPLAPLRYLVFGLEVAWYLNQSDAEAWIKSVKSREGLLSAATGALPHPESEVEDECTPWDETATCNGWVDKGEAYWPDGITPINKWAGEGDTHWDNETTTIHQWVSGDNRWDKSTRPSNWADNGVPSWGNEPAIVDEWAGDGDTHWNTKPTTCSDWGGNGVPSWGNEPTTVDEWAGDSDTGWNAKLTTCSDWGDDGDTYWPDGTPINEWAKAKDPQNLAHR